MFVGRENELKDIKKILGKPGNHAIMLYGKRRIGKSSLILRALSQVKCKVVYYECVLSSLEANLRGLEKNISEITHNPYLHFADFFELFNYLGTLREKVIVVIDEYPYLKQLEAQGYIDSIMQKIIDNLGGNVDVVLLGSYIGMMKELLEKENPLFGRFDLVLNVKSFDYLDSSLFYKGLPVRKKTEFYSVFGGSPFVNCQIKIGESLEKNIIDLMLNTNGILRLYVEHVLLGELRKAGGANQILAALGNGHKRYGEIEAMTGGIGNGNLDKQLKNLLEMEIVSKVYPINKPDDRRKCFYEISDNLVRFYYCYVYGRGDVIMRIGEKSFFKLYVKESLPTFLSHRFEGLAREYFMRSAKRNGKIKDVGVFWYDLPKEKKNGEIDIALAYQEGYEFYETKYYGKKLTKQDVEEAVAKMAYCCNFVNIKKLGVVSLSGFDFSSRAFALLDGERIYRR